MLHPVTQCASMLGRYALNFLNCMHCVHRRVVLINCVVTITFMLKKKIALLMHRMLS
jgi:hypothetical protein